MTNIIT